MSGAEEENIVLFPDIVFPVILEVKSPPVNIKELVIKDDPLPDPENEDLELEECDDREELEDLENEDRDDLEDDRDEPDDLEERELELCLDGGILIHLFL